MACSACRRGSRASVCERRQNGGLRARPSHAAQAYWIDLKKNLLFGIRVAPHNASDVGATGYSPARPFDLAVPARSRVGRGARRGVPLEIDSSSLLVRACARVSHPRRLRGRRGRFLGSLNDRGRNELHGYRHRVVGCSNDEQRRLPTHESRRLHDPLRRQRRVFDTDAPGPEPRSGELRRDEPVARHMVFRCELTYEFGCAQRFVHYRQ